MSLEGWALVGGGTWGRRVVGFDGAIDAQDERVCRWRSVVTEPTYRPDFELGPTRGSCGLRDLVEYSR